MDRLISLSVGVTGVEDYVRTFEDISELARNMVESHEYVNVSASVIGAPDEDEPCCKHEHLHYDDQTLVKVRQTLMDSVAPYGYSDYVVDQLLYDLQNAGILFRERKPSTEKLVDQLLKTWIPWSHR